MPFARFMEQALYHPAHGYYSSGRARIGRGGDYFTSVSVGPLFGRMMAAQFAEIRERLGSPDDFTIVEQGAHRGEFARDVLQHFDGGVRYVIVELFPALREEQRRTLRGFDVEWCGEIPPFRGVHFSNELIDSMPVHLVQWTGSEWLERHLDENLIFVDLPIANPQLVERVAQIPLPLPSGYETEVNLAALEWIETLALKLEQGFIIAADYGFPRDEYYALHRTRGTLQSYVNHKLLEDPLANVGEADLTAHVEWTSLAERALECGMQLAGFMDQHHFLTGLLTEELTADAKSTRALQTLI
ncbi:MAG: SAM-dependent methyltransferase, partial [Verrucomicrobiota bacterium]|nr:SAM-dependent methyltransferase [Verrucomicrobiota bacterium]